MPEISSRLSGLCPDTYIKVWQINESAEFFAQFPKDWSMPPQKAHIQTKKHLESLAARFCLWQLMQALELSDWTLLQDDRNRPYIEHPEWHVSISHSFPFATACISKKQLTGIDLEKRGRKIQTIAPRFLNSVELNSWQADDLMLTLAWSAKESIYKACQIKGLSLQKEMQLNMNQGNMTGQVYAKEPFPVYYEIFEDFVLTLVNH
jgi:4'-phosphopantetheinyl transferase